MSPTHLITTAHGLFPAATALAHWAQDRPEPRLHDIGEALECAALSEDAAAVIELEDRLADAVSGALWCDDGDWLYSESGRAEE